MPADRYVHEILFSKAAGGRPYAAFIQHGTREDGYKYEVICPYCALTVGQFEEDKDDLGPIELFTPDIAKKIKPFMKTHLFLCAASGMNLRVRKSLHPLGTEQIVREM